jgi:hypothetical protein
VAAAACENSCTEMAMINATAIELKNKKNPNGSLSSQSTLNNSI